MWIHVEAASHEFRKTFILEVLKLFSVRTVGNCTTFGIIYPEFLRKVASENLPDLWDYYYWDTIQSICQLSNKLAGLWSLGRFFRIPTQSHKLFKFKKSTTTPHFFKTNSRLWLQHFWKPDSDNFEKTTPTILKKRLRIQLKTCDSTNSDSTTLVVTAVDAASYL